LDLKKNNVDEVKIAREEDKEKVDVAQEISVVTAEENRSGSRQEQSGGVERNIRGVQRKKWG
jgi:hypothetical protein